MAGRDTIYVQIDIDGTLERVWQLTQTPDFHQKWDLRFSSIEYLPRVDGQPQRFLYTTRIGMGLNIRGEGESIAVRDGANGRRSSSLKFWSDDPKSLIEKGSGYWKYEPHEASGNMVRFVTGYDYSVRFGMLGRAFDRVVFRPLIGWATAWSFDRLRLWIEKDLDPSVAMRLSVINFAARLSLAVVWLYEGLVPKLIFLHPDETAMLQAMGLSEAGAHRFCTAVGLAEVGLGMSLLLLWRSRWPLWLTLFLMPLALLAVAMRSPSFLAGPFNPAVLNISVFAVVLIALVAGHDLPSASHCLRRPSKESP